MSGLLALKESFHGEAAGWRNAGARRLIQLGMEKHPTAPNPSFSIAVVTCNQSKKLQEALASLISQPGFLTEHLFTVQQNAAAACRRVRG